MPKVSENHSQRPLNLNATGRGGVSAITERMNSRNKYLERYPFGYRSCERIPQRDLMFLGGFDLYILQTDGGKRGHLSATEQRMVGANEHMSAAFTSASIGAQSAFINQ